MVKKIGEISIDSGFIYCGDPCYFWASEKKGSAQHTIGKSWGAFCKTLDDVEYPQHKSYDGLGVIAQTGYGDGTYPVYAKIENGRIKSITIEFDATDEENYEEYDEDREDDEYEEDEELLFEEV